MRPQVQWHDRRRFKSALKKRKVDLLKGGKDRSKQFNGKCERFFKMFKLWRRLTLQTGFLPRMSNTPPEGLFRGNLRP
jgi:transposase InsO family protein